MCYAFIYLNVLAGRLTTLGSTVQSFVDLSLVVYVHARVLLSCHINRSSTNQQGANSAAVRGSVNWYVRVPLSCLLSGDEAFILLTSAAWCVCFGLLALQFIMAR